MVIIQAMFMIAATMPINKAVKVNNNEKTMLNKPIEINNYKLINHFYRISQLKRVLRFLFNVEKKETKIEKTFGGFSLKVRGDKFHQLMEETSIKPTEANMIRNKEDVEMDSFSEDFVHHIEMKWFNRIN